MKALYLVMVVSLVMSLCNLASAKPLKVYILAGQSNMVGMASSKTLEHLKLDPQTAEYFKDVFDADGKPVVLDAVYISSISASSEGVPAVGKLGPEFGARGRGQKIGPEYTFGIYIHKALKEPIVLIKASFGGKSLHFDFRPPSAGEWKPPAGHPDLTPKKKPAPLALPKKIDLPVGYVPPDDVLPRYATGRIGKFMGLRLMRGVAIGRQNGVYPIYLTSSPEEEFEGTPFKKGDLIVGVDGEGLREDAVGHWRDVFNGSKTTDDWMIKVTRWRDGKLETFDFDISQALPGGRADIPKVLAEREKARVEGQKNKGRHYKLMMDHIKSVLADVKKVHPDYDPEQGYEIAGFVWFQGWNDMVNGGVYPNRDHPRGYDKYSWLLKHFIRDVRKELKAPDMPFVIGVMGVGGVIERVGDNQAHFRRAMAAPAGEAEFKDTVAAVYTEKYWPERLDKLAQRSSKLSQYRKMLEIRDGLKGEALNKAYAEYRSLYFTPEEELILKVGKSNQGFHYLGSGKFMAAAGRGFAEAMVELHEKVAE